MKIKLIIPIIIAVIMTSCTQIVIDSADEIRMNTWSTKLQNGSAVSLRFKQDTACFKIISSDKDACACIKGLGLIDDSKIMIYNKSDNEPYLFNYIIKNNTLKLTYNKDSILLLREKNVSDPPD